MTDTRGGMRGVWEGYEGRWHEGGTRGMWEGYEHGMTSLIPLL